MKSAREILTHVIASDKVYEKKFCFMQIKSFLPKTLAEHILFMYDKGDTLFFVFDHPAYKQEFHYKVSVIKELLNDFKEQLSACSHIKELKAFVSHKALPKELPPSATEPHYKEHSDGVFENSAEDCDVRAKFEEIRKVISS